jgi:hypothetical protein
MLPVVVYIIQSWLNYFHSNRAEKYAEINPSKMVNLLEKKGYSRESYSSVSSPTFSKETEKEHKYVDNGKCLIDVTMDSNCNYYPFIMKSAVLALAEEEDCHPLSILLELLYK